MIKKITFCAYDKPDSVGGPVTWLMHLLPALQRYGFDVNCLIFYHVGNNGPLTEHLKKNNIALKGTSFNYYTEDNIQWLLQQLKSNQPDIFVPNLVVPAYLATPWIKKAGIKIIGVSHSDDPFYHAIQELFIDGKEKFRAHGMIVVSKELEYQLNQSPQIANIKLERIPYGVQIPKEKAEWNDNTLKVVYVGRLSEEQKRISEVTKAFCKMVQEVPNTEAIIYGEGPDRNNVENILCSEGKGLPVYLGGNIPALEMQQKLLDAHVIVLLSDYEGLPIAILEAMACGVVPVCLNMRSGITEQIKNGVTGYIVSDRDKDFIHTINKIASNKGLWQTISLNAKKVITDNFSMELCHHKYIKYFNSLAISKQKKEIKLPKRYNLLFVHPDLARADRRKQRKKISTIIKTKITGLKKKLLTQYY